MQIEINENGLKTLVLPKSFWVMAKRFEVKIVENLQKDMEVWGRASTGRALFEIDARHEGMSPDEIGATFCHELMHVLFGSVGRHDLSDDEHLVEQMGRVLQQVILSAEY